MHRLLPSCSARSSGAAPGISSAKSSPIIIRNLGYSSAQGYNSAVRMQYPSAGVVNRALSSAGPIPLFHATNCLPTQTPETCNKSVTSTDDTKLFSNLSSVFSEEKFLPDDSQRLAFDSDGTDQESELMDCFSWWQETP